MQGNPVMDTHIHSIEQEAHVVHVLTHQLGFSLIATSHAVGYLNPHDFAASTTHTIVRVLLAVGAAPSILHTPWARTCLVVLAALAWPTGHLADWGAPGRGGPEQGNQGQDDNCCGLHLADGRQGQTCMQMQPRDFPLASRSQRPQAWFAHHLHVTWR